jgi:hypothetical protein
MMVGSTVGVRVYHDLVIALSQWGTVLLALFSQVLHLFFT